MQHPENTQQEEEPANNHNHRAVAYQERSEPTMTLIENQTNAYCPLNTVIMTQENDPGVFRRMVFGSPLRTEGVPRRKIGRRIGLAAFGSDALSSVTYATQEILHILVLAGAAALSLAIPIAGAICLLLIILALSYRQIIFAYPKGGGAYTVTRDNLGSNAAQFAGAALLTDYVLTVAVSVSAGVEQIASALPMLLPHRVILCIFFVLLITLSNLRGVRGVRETDRFFPIPIFFFITMMLLLLGYGFWHWSQETLPQVSDVSLQMQAIQPLSIFLVLRAFSSGAIALTGMDAISNRVKVFREPRSRNAAFVIIVMSGLLLLTFMGITMLARFTHALPLETETIISQLARTIFGANSILYYLMIVSTAGILFMAANTSFAGFPRLAAAQAADGFLPRWLAMRGHRLAFSWGIFALAIGAILLIVAFDARTTDLIPLYAIGVFLGFTLAQAGMVVRWYRVSRLRPGEEFQEGTTHLRHDSRWMFKLALNALGCFVTAVVTLVFAVSKFTHGAWVSLVVIAILVWIYMKIRHHYTTVAQSLSLENYRAEPEVEPARHTAVVLVSGVHQGTLAAARYARSIHASKLVAVHVATDPDQVSKVHERWKQWVPDVPLMVVDSPYRTLIKPLVSYINTLAEEETTDLVTIVIPQFICVRWWHRLLHNQTIFLIRSAFVFDRDKVVIEVPFRLREE